MDKQQIMDALEALNDELAEQNIRGEICLYGGAVMCLSYDARPSTKDVDAVFQPAAEIRSAAARVAERLELSPDWLNDGVKGFLVDHPRRILLTLPNLAVYAAEPDYLFAMKALAARVDTADRDDVRLLLSVLNITRLEDALALIEKYYPRHAVKPATLFFIEEIFDDPH